MLYEILSYIGPRYDGTRLYLAEYLTLSSNLPWNRHAQIIYNNRRRELAQNKAEPGKNWNSFETFIFITLRVSSYKINQDPGREKSGRHFFRPFSRWPPLKIAKIKNKHNFDIIEPRKVILVSNSMFLSMIYSLVHLKMHFEVTWPEIQYGRHLNPLDMHWLKNTWWFLYSKCCPFGNIL